MPCCNYHVSWHIRWICPEDQQQWEIQNCGNGFESSYGIDMEKTQYSKLIDNIPTPDIVISMGCDVGCPYIGRPFDDNWGLPDPTGHSDDVFRNVIRQIEANIRSL
jgi:protein-tyrosine-phosphatase